MVIIGGTVVAFQEESSHKNICQIFSPYRKECYLRQRHGFQSLTLTSCFYKNILSKSAIFFYESIFQDKSIYMVFIFPNSTT